MSIIVEERLSESPLVERVWCSRSENINTFISIAAFQLDLVITRYQGTTSVTLRGPETQASQAPVPEDAEFFGIIFRPGVFFPHLPNLTNSFVDLPGATGQSFWLKSGVWQVPTYENADTFADQLLRDDVLAYEPVIETVLRGHSLDMSLRSVQRRFLHTTGLTYRTMQQIERARRAALRLQQGASILDTTFELGYFDQAYLTKSLKHFIGLTPTQLIQQSEQLSLLYKTDSFDWYTMKG